ncbi:MAG: hypothetical protein KAG61_05370 [Bacteriovoracaceae bacterium]|nr:hypothetical protein [Bacteriovoracaceae bacterium]
MSKLTYALVTTVTLATLLTTALAAECRPEKRAVKQKQEVLSGLSVQISNKNSRIRNLSSKISNLQSEINSAQRDVRSAKSSLRKLRDTNNRAPEIIRDNRQSISRIKVQLPPMEEEAERLRKKYRSIKVKFTTVIKRGIAKIKWKKQARKVTKKKNQIVGHRNRIQEVKRVVENFDSLEDQKIRRLHRLERKLDEVEDNRYEIRELRQRRSVVQEKLQSLELRRERVQRNLQAKRRALQVCLAH